MSDRKNDPRDSIRKDWKVFTRSAQKTNVDKMNKAQYADELEHKVKVYDDVKATLNLCHTMIAALDATTEDECFNRLMLIQYLDIARTEALLAVIGVEHEIGGLGK